MIPFKINIKNLFFPEEISFKFRAINSYEKFKAPMNATKIPGIIFEGIIERVIMNLKPQVFVVFLLRNFYRKKLN